MVSASNGMPFRVRHQDRSTSINANAGCTATRRSGYLYYWIIIETNSFVSVIFFW